MINKIIQAIFLLTLVVLISIYKPTVAMEMPPTVDYKLAKVVSEMINCESSGHNISIIDSNGLPSRGILMYQDATWSEWEVESGITGSPMNEGDAIKMAWWAVAKGYGNRWTCYKNHKGWGYTPLLALK